YANGVVGPSLLDKNSDDIFGMIKAYKTDEKPNVLMRYLISQMDDKEIRSLADEIAEFNKEVREKK
ncbi:MAG: c-type cytochrome, partial [Campylobacteraceae bacterium]